MDQEMVKAEIAGYRSISAGQIFSVLSWPGNECRILLRFPAVLPAAKNANITDARIFWGNDINASAAHFR
jgi:hypothetical protein